MPGSGIPRWKCLHTHAPRACSDLQRASNSNCPLMAPPWAHRSLARFPIGCHSHRGPGRFERLLIRRSPIAKSTTIAKMYMSIALPNTKMHMGGQECSHARAQSTHSTLRNQRAALAARGRPPRRCAAACVVRTCTCTCTRAPLLPVISAIAAFRKCSHGLSICHLGFGYLALLASAPTATVAAAVAATDTGTAAYLYLAKISHHAQASPQSHSLNRRLSHAPAPHAASQ